MTLYLWSKITFLLFSLSILFAGMPGIPKWIGTPRNFLYLSCSIFLIFLNQRKHRSLLKSLWEGRHPDITKRSYDKWSYLVIALGFITYFKVALINTLDLKLIDVDFSYFDLMIGSFVRGKGWLSDACGCNHMGVHSTYLFYLFAPIHYLFNSPFVLQVIHALTLGASLIPLKKIMESFKVRRDFSLAFLFAFISYSPFIIILDYNFHFEVFFIPFFLWMLYYYRMNRWSKVHLFALLSLMVKEDAGFYLLGFFATIIFEKRNFKQASILLLYTLLITYSSLKIFIPAHRDSSDYILAGTASVYGTSIEQVLVNMAKDPFGVLKYVLLGKWWKFLIPFAGLPLIEVGFLLAVAPFIVIHSTASSPTMRNLMLYYVAPFLPFLIFYFFKRIQKIKRPKLQNGIILFSILYIALVGGGRIRMDPLLSDHVIFRDYVKSLDLKNKKICAQGSLLPHLGYDSMLTPLARCAKNVTYDYVFIGKGINPYPFGHEEIEEKIRSIGNNYQLDKKIGELYVFKSKK